MNNTNILLCGVGGQGTVLASRLLALAGMQAGKQVRTAETIGMSQRGGCVVSHVRMGDELYSSLIPLHCADVIIAFEPGEGIRCLPYLKPDGYLIVNSKTVSPVTAALSSAAYEAEPLLDYLHKTQKHLIIVNGEAIAEACRSPKVLNCALLGAAVTTGALGMTADELEQAIVTRVPEKYKELNRKAFRLAQHQINQGGTNT